MFANKAIFGYDHRAGIKIQSNSSKVSNNLCPPQSVQSAPEIRCQVTGGAPK
jgi:hypothetical protein